MGETIAWRRGPAAHDRVHDKGRRSGAHGTDLRRSSFGWTTNQARAALGHDLAVGGRYADAAPARPI